MPLWARVVILSGLLSMSAIFAGLTLGLFSLDVIELEVRKIYNQLLANFDRNDY